MSHSPHLQLDSMAKSCGFALLNFVSATCPSMALFLIQASTLSPPDPPESPPYPSAWDKSCATLSHPPWRTAPRTASLKRKHGLSSHSTPSCPRCLLRNPKQAAQPFSLFCGHSLPADHLRTPTEFYSQSTLFHTCTHAAHSACSALLLLLCLARSRPCV